jgi:hypothetical protein
MATTKFNPQYRPVRTSTHFVVGRYDLYRMKSINEDKGGAQASFIVNNARPNRRNEYGIKLFGGISQAFAAYQRQKMAAELGIAPPVRRMVCVETTDHRGDRRFVWGYQTCLAYGIGRIAVDEMAERYRNPKWCSESGVRRLYTLMLTLSTNGTQMDFGPIGVNYRGRRSPRMAEDLHCENLGFWRKSPVVIDFGSHLVGAAV